MERRTALLSAGAITLGLGSATVALAVTGSVNLLGFGGPHRASAVSTSPTTTQAKARVVTRRRNVYDKFVVSVPTDPPAASVDPGGSGGRSAAPAPGPYVIPVTAQPAAPPATPPAPAAKAPPAPRQPSAPNAPQTTTTVTAPPTTVTTPPPQTTTTVCHRHCSDDPPGDD